MDQKINSDNDGTPPHREHNRDDQQPVLSTSSDQSKRGTRTLH